MYGHPLLFQNTDSPTGQNSHEIHTNEWICLCIIELKKGGMEMIVLFTSHAVANLVEYYLLLQWH